MLTQTGEICRRQGFTILEVLVALVILTFGVLGTMTVAARVTQMVAQGHRFTEISTIASQRLEMLRSQSCASWSSGSTVQGGFVVSWVVDSASTANLRSVRVTVVSRTARGMRADEVTTAVACQGSDEG